MRTGVSHVGGVALVAEQRIAEELVGPLNLLQRSEEKERVLRWHQRYRYSRHVAEQGAPNAGGENHERRLDRASRGFDATDTALVGQDVRDRRIRKRLQGTRVGGAVDHFEHDIL